MIPFLVSAPRKLAGLTLLLSLLLSPTLNSLAQDYRIDWQTLDAGGGTSTGGPYTLSGTIGQPDASSSAATGSVYDLLGGFWPGWIQLSSPGLPTLEVRWTTEGIVLSWPDAFADVTLQETSDLTRDLWETSPQENGVPFTPSDLARYYRLATGSTSSQSSSLSTTLRFKNLR